jgi:hypothetical protein
MSTDLLYPGNSQPISVALEPAHIMQHSLLMLSIGEETSGFDDWVYRTAATMTPDERDTNRLVMIGLYYATTPYTSYSSFPVFIEHLANESPLRLRNLILDAYIRMGRQAGDEERPTYDDILVDVNTFLTYLRRGFDDDHIDPELERRAYTYLIDPPAMQQLIVGHLRAMWYKYLAVEWERVRPLLQKAVRAFEAIDLAALDRQAAVEYVIGRPMPKKNEKWCIVLENHEQIVFVPSAHIGPYTKWFTVGDRAWILFGPRLPQDALEDVPDLSRAELLVRLNALADDTRLGLLRLVAERGELRSQDIMQLLDLSQSGASRHLQQLTAVGFLNERRCNGAKCYTPNQERLDSTLQALGSFLSPRPEPREIASPGRARG